MKRKLALLLVTTVVVGSMLTACGTSGDRTSDEVQTQQDAGMVHIEGGGEAVDAFFTSTYANVSQDMLPASIGTMEIDLSDAELLAYQTGLTDVSNVEAIYVSESMIGSVPYSAVYIVTKEGADATVVLNELMTNINPAKWLCVSAEKQIGATFGNDVFYVMSFADTADAVYESAVSVAEGMTMKVANKTEKMNAQ